MMFHEIIERRINLNLAGGVHMITRLMIICGVILLILLCWRDFKEKILRPKSSVRYFISLGLFLIVNIAIYLGLFLLILRKSPFELFISPPIDSQISAQDLFQPMLIAVLYFGAGAATFKLGNTEISIYQKMLDMFQSIFRISLTKFDEIKKSIYEATAKYEKLEAKISELHTKADYYKGWDKLQDRWEDISDDAKMLNDHIAELTSIHNNLVEPISHKKITEIKKGIASKINELSNKVIDKYKKYILQFIITNIRNESEIEEILKDIDVIAPEPPPPQPPNIIYRSLVISFMFGLLFGPVFYLFDKSDPIAYSWYGAFSLCVFGFILSLIRKTEKRFQNFFNVIVLGILAGASGYLVWMILTFKMDIVNHWDKVLKYIIFGISFGAAIALLLYLFRWYVRNRISHVLLKYILIGLSGAFIFYLLTLAFRPQIMTHVKLCIGIGLLGFVVLMAMAFAMDIFGNGRVN
jgi:hypothetical protein